jgi:mannosyl-oligosaccharide alpha-1,2-mannosidase
MDIEKGEFVGSHVSLGALGDSFYKYLIKSYVQSGHKDDQAYRMYKEASKTIRKKMVFTSKGGLKYVLLDELILYPHVRYVAELRNGVPEHKFSHLACFCPGMFALEADNEKDPDEKRQIMQLAEDLAHTCHESYVRSASGIGPEMFYFNEVNEATSKRRENGYILRLEAIEGWFYLWRLTNREVSFLRV